MQDVFPSNLNVALDLIINTNFAHNSCFYRWGSRLRFAAQCHNLKVCPFPERSRPTAGTGRRPSGWSRTSSLPWQDRASSTCTKPSASGARSNLQGERIRHISCQTQLGPMLFSSMDDAVACQKCQRRGETLVWQMCGLQTWVKSGCLHIIVCHFNLEF